MSVQFSKAAIIAKNKTAIDACDASTQRLGQIVGLPVSKEGQRLAQLSRASNEKKQLRAVNAHLTAAATTVKPMADETAKELNDLGNKLDDQIAKDAITNATISFITSVLDDVNKIQTITTAHKG
jgi:hypothetical protein